MKSIKSFIILALIGLISTLCAQEGYIKLRASTDGVEISVNETPPSGKHITNTSIGVDWSFITIEPGSYTITASKRDYPNQLKNVHISPGYVETVEFKFTNPTQFRVEKPQEVKVVKGYGHLTIVTDTPGATIKLNGLPVPAEVTPMTIRDLAQGEWIIEATLMGQLKTTKVKIEPMRLSTVRIFFNADAEMKYLNEQEAEKLRISRELEKNERLAKIAQAEEVLTKAEAKPIATIMVVFYKGPGYDPKNPYADYYASDWTQRVEPRNSSFVDRYGINHKLTISYQWKGYSKVGLRLKEDYEDKYRVNVDGVVIGEKAFRNTESRSNASRWFSSLEFGEFFLKFANEKDSRMYYNVFQRVTEHEKHLLLSGLHPSLRL
jgi:hypothetical protein